MKVIHPDVYHLDIDVLDLQMYKSRAVYSKNCLS